MFEKIKAARQRFQARRREIVTIDVGFHAALIDIGVDVAEQALTEGMTGAAARDYVAGEVFDRIEGAIVGNPDLWQGAAIERLDDLVGLVAEVGYRMLKLKGVL
jgi:hypothetical protein